ncbi:hypothetical protein ACIHEI_07015 [Kitasatospora sp. NPDC051984]|uniref:hypothetical protein n=1 Tax=Kitasatospora sp. NPDC051984 TaxID=3364059 RepID=UPI0037C7E9E3
MSRLRLRYRAGYRPRLVLTDTPDPKCPECHGAGGQTDGYCDEFGEYADADHIPCGCWNPYRPERALPLPRWAARRLFGWTDPSYSDEPPF